MTAEPVSILQQPGRDAVIVLGMHRSGTSALSRFLAELGFAQAHRIVAPQADNPKGFWEPAEIVDFNNRVLKSFGSTWADPSAFWSDDGSRGGLSLKIPARLLEGHVEEAVRTLLAAYHGHDRICIKDPRLVVVSELWTMALDRAGFRRHPVFVYRNPLDVVGSLRIRNGIDTHTGFRLLLKHLVPSLQALVSADRATAVDFARLRNDPGSEARRLTEHFKAGGVSVIDPDSAAVKRCISPDDVNVRAPDGALERLPKSPLVELIREADRLVRRYLANGELPPAAVGTLEQDFLGYCLENGHMNLVPLSRPQSPPRGEQQPPRRRIVFHYHLFKNAGTSVDAVLKRNFGERYRTREFRSGGLEPNKAEVEQWIATESDAVAFSSHTALAVVRQTEDADVFPVVFVRHPLDRIHSAYLFEHKQDAETRGARLAKQTDFAGYVRARLDDAKDFSIRDFQARRLAAWPRATDQDRLLAAALSAVDSLPFVGLVERFDDSMERLRDWLVPHFPDFRVFPVRQNVTQHDTTLEDRLAEVERLLGPELFDRLVKENRADMAVYERVKARLHAVNSR